MYVRTIHAVEALREIDANSTPKSSHTPTGTPNFCQILPSERAKHDVNVWFRAMKQNHETQKEIITQTKTLMEGEQKLMEKMLELARIRWLEVPFHNSITVNPDENPNSETDNNNIQTHQNISMN